MTKHSAIFRWLSGIYFALLALHIAARMEWLPASVASASKPMLMPILIVLVLLHMRNNARKQAFIVAALFCSWLGDILLMFSGEGFFISGLVSFLVAHILYIIFYASIIREHTINNKKVALLYLLPAWLYGVLLMIILAPALGGMLLPVMVYAMAICTMLSFAIILYVQQKNIAAGLLLAGSILFVLSDSLLAFNKFYYAWSLADAMVMITYGMAQWLIVKGALRLEPRDRMASNHNPA